jgi:hypothetical protein
MIRDPCRSVAALNVDVPGRLIQGDVVAVLHAHIERPRSHYDQSLQKSVPPVMTLMILPTKPGTTQSPRINHMTTMVGRPPEDIRRTTNKLGTIHETESLGGSGNPPIHHTTPPSTKNGGNPTSAKKLPPPRSLNPLLASCGLQVSLRPTKTTTHHSLFAGSVFSIFNPCS